MPNSRQLLCLLIALTTVTLVSNNALAQTNKSSSKDQKFADQFWTYLLSNNYKHWSSAPGKTTEHFASRMSSQSNTRSPHGTTMKMYVNRTAASNPNSLPIGSVLIVENYLADKTLDSISVMYRTEGFNPSANDWYWVNYNPNGTVASEKFLDHANGITTVNNGLSQTYASASSPKKLMGRTQSCIQCHQSGGNDLAFFNNDANQTRVIRGANRLTNSPLVTTPALTGNTAGNSKLNQNQLNSFSSQ